MLVDLSGTAEKRKKCTYKYFHNYTYNHAHKNFKIYGQRLTFTNYNELKFLNQGRKPESRRDSI